MSYTRLSSALLAATCACGPSVPADELGPDGGGGPGDRADAATCGQVELTIEAIEPNVLIVLDRSCSMTENSGGSTRWEHAVAAVNQLTSDQAGQIRWGLNLFPDTQGGQCGQGTPTVPIGVGVEGEIQTLLTGALNDNNALFPDGPCVTNIDTAMLQASENPAFAAADRPSYVLLITDGAQSGCDSAGGDDGTRDIIGALYADRGIKTFVVGFGGDVAASDLNAFATLGGAPLAGGTKYYQANNAADLDAALAAIATSVVSCSFQVDEAPPNLDEVYSYFNDSIQVPRSPEHADGWDFDPTTKTFTFYGSFCDQLQSAEVTDIDFVYGCPGPSLE